MKPISHLPTVLAATAALALLGVACSNDSPKDAPASSPQTSLPQIGVPNANGAVVKSRATFAITSDSSGRIVAVVPVVPAPTPIPGDPSPVPSDVPSPAPSDVPSPVPSDFPSPVPSTTPLPSPTASTSVPFPIEVTNAASTSMSVDSSEWIMPTVSNNVVDFGFLAISGLTDNNLRVCGNGRQRCTSAQIRMYTTGVNGAGVWNEEDQWGAPITASLAGTEPTGTVGLDVAGAAVLQSVAIPANMRILRLADFVPAPRYNVKADFTEAGAGTYTTTVVLEYVLVP